MNNLNDFVFTFTIHFASMLSFFKICNYKNIGNLAKMSIVVLSIVLSFLQVILSIPIFFKLIFICLIYSIIFSKVTHMSFENCFVIKLLSLTLAFSSATISSAISLLLTLLINQTPENICYFIFDFILTIIFICLFFKIKRFKNGFPFIKNLKNNFYINFFILFTTIIIILAYFILAGLTNISIQNLFYGFLLLFVILLIIIQKAFSLYNKQKLQLQALKDYEQELSETKQKLETAIQEKERIVKSNHEFYHRQEALNKKLDILMKNKLDAINAEFSNDYSDILDRLNTLSDEYKSKTNFLPSLVKTNIVEIDDMLIYMQSECAKNSIEFNVKIDCDITHILTNFITKSQLETLLGDLIRNAIIAINYSSNSYKSILVIFGIKDDAYEICIYDSGIPFEINTLINLGMQPASTHLDDGGTGIGFITTFETMNSCKASFIINEITNNNYTKSLEVKFDNQNEYEIISNRAEEIRKANVLNRNIVLK